MNSNEPRYIKVRGAKAPEMQGTTYNVFFYGRGSFLVLVLHKKCTM